MQRIDEEPGYHRLHDITSICDLFLVQEPTDAHGICAGKRSRSIKSPHTDLHVLLVTIFPFDSICSSCI